MSKRQTILILYTELAEYIRNCIELLPQAGFDVDVVAWPVNPEAPFQFRSKESPVKYHNRKKLSTRALLQIAHNIQPAVILCSGWIDKGYLSVCWAFRKRSYTVLTLDNKWSGGLKQIIASWGGRVLMNKYFSHCWVPGQAQYRYARKLGFNASQVYTGFYTADVPRFEKLYKESIAQKRTAFPKRYIYVGRYTEFKGIRDLWTAFSRKNKTDWELWCLGTGELFQDKPLISGVSHFGFVQPREMDNFVQNTTVFILPSKIEPWGVVVHEFAAAGFPLLCSKNVGSASAFLESGKNGYTFSAGEPESIINAMNKIESHSEEELLAMGEYSQKLARKITPQKWVETLMAITAN